MGDGRDSVLGSESVRGARSLIPARGRTGSRHREELAFPTIRSCRGGSEGAEEKKSSKSPNAGGGGAVEKRKIRRGAEENAFQG